MHRSLQFAGKQLAPYVGYAAIKSESIAPRPKEQAKPVPNLYGDTTLTPKQVEVADLVWQGYKNSAIGQRMGTTEGQIKNYLRVIYDKTGTFNRTELALRIEAGKHTDLYKEFARELIEATTNYRATKENKCH